MDDIASNNKGVFYDKALGFEYDASISSDELVDIVGSYECE